MSSNSPQQAPGPVLTWQKRMEPDRQYWGAHDERPYMLAEIADLRAALAAVPGKGEPVAWSYECRQPHTYPVIWAEFLNRKKPSEDSWVRNIQALFAAPVGEVVAAPPDNEEILSLHRQLAAEKLRADQGWQRYESANADRNALRAEKASEVVAATEKDCYCGGFGDVHQDGCPEVHAPAGEIVATDLSSLTRYDAFGDPHKNGPYVLFDDVAALPRQAPAPEKAPRRPLAGCAAGRDGECTHPDCPQLRDNEPKDTGRHCPLDTTTGEEQ